MEKSATESTTENAYTLRLELKKTMTEILDDGGVSEDRGAIDERCRNLKRDQAIDEAIRILNSLREVESKIPDSSSSPASVLEVPKEFKCVLSRAIMSEPVVIASGQTYEKRYIQQWLMYKQTCPKTKEVLSHFLWSPNHVIDELITQWCQANNYDRPESSDAPVGLFSDDIDIARSMEESTAESTAETADTLKRELKKLLTVILSNGGVSEDGGESDESSGVLKAIDEAIRLLNRLREVESKKLESDIPSSSSSSSQSPKVEVPNEFKCVLSNAIMIEPVVIASGITYEKSFITESLKDEHKCPKSNEVLSHSLCTPNHLLDELITKWCIVNGYDRLKPADEVVTELSRDGIESLLQRISSPSSYEDQVQAAKEIRCQTNKFPNVRDRFLTLHPEVITTLISPLTELGMWAGMRPELQENIITALLNISIAVANKEVIAKNYEVLEVLTTALTSGTIETRRNSASTLLSLLAIASNNLSIGYSSTLRALGELIGEGEIVASLVASSVVYQLCQEFVFRQMAVSEGVVPVLMGKIEAGSYAAEFLSVLVLLTTYKPGVKEIEKSPEFIEHLFSILRKRSCLRSCENAVVIVINVCNLATHIGRLLRVVNEEENKHATFTMLTKEGSSESLVKNAEMVLELLKVNGTDQAPALE